jgi:hypothetical protein
VLMRLIGAGDQLDMLLGLHAEDIDEQLLEMLYSRIQLAVRSASWSDEQPGRCRTGRLQGSEVVHISHRQMLEVHHTRV